MTKLRENESAGSLLRTEWYYIGKISYSTFASKSVALVLEKNTIKKYFVCMDITTSMWKKAGSKCYSLFLTHNHVNCVLCQKRTKQAHNRGGRKRTYTQKVVGLSAQCCYVPSRLQGAPRPQQETLLWCAAWHQACHPQQVSLQSSRSQTAALPPRGHLPK